MAAVLDGDHVVGVALQSCNLLPRNQIPHFTASICGRRGGSRKEKHDDSHPGARQLGVGRSVKVSRERWANSEEGIPSLRERKICTCAYVCPRAHKKIQGRAVGKNFRSISSVSTAKVY